jgi:hypothetical protein
VKPVNFKIILWGVRIGYVRQYGPHEFKAWMYPRLPQEHSGLVDAFINGGHVFSKPLGEFTSLTAASNAIGESLRKVQP